MPRQARIDIPGALHHIIGRGIERRKIFQDDTDREDFVGRLGDVLRETATPCLAWALIPNHFHLLLVTGAVPVATVMHRLLTGYAVNYNRRHHRHGHLFQNRYKSILCQEEPYLLELVRYIHLNPLRAQIVTNLEALDHYRYSGHSALMGKRKRDWQDTDKVLALFANRPSPALSGYRQFVEEGIEMGRRPELTGGGLIRSAGGWVALKSGKEGRDQTTGDERILGEGEFVESVLKEAEENIERRQRLRAQGYDFQKVVSRAGELIGLNVEEVIKPGKQPQRVQARSLVCYWAVIELGLVGTSVAKMLGMSQPAVSKAVQRGRRLAADKGYTLRGKL
jgi:REP element-mobilizing transposase RayT